MVEATIVFSEELKEYFKLLNLEWHLFPDKTTKKLKSLDSFNKFVGKEADFWDSCTSGTVSEIRNYFYQMKNLLESAMTHSDPNSAKNLISDVTRRISINQYPCIFSTTEIGRQIKKIYEMSPRRADGFIEYLIGKPGYVKMHYASFSDKEFVAGALFGFSFENPDVTKVLTEEEKNARLSSIQSLADMVNQSIGELSDETDRVREISNIEATKIQELQKSFEADKDVLLFEGKERIKELEDLYTEKLRLSAPAQYWEDTKKSYFNQGIVWTLLTVALTIGFLWGIKWLIFNIQKQESVIAKVTKTINFDTVKYGILLTLCISVGIFLVNFFIKLAISAFHLSRDANERLQLTHLYLALLNENAITTEERVIVLQSLFSRADTGLLKGDSSPTIPDNGIIGLISKSMGKS
jgi:hypothetical protein